MEFPGTEQEQYARRRSEVSSLIVAGFETIATAPAWSLGLLCRHPRMLERANVWDFGRPMSRAYSHWRSFCRNTHCSYARIGARVIRSGCHSPGRGGGSSACRTPLNSSLDTQTFAQWMDRGLNMFRIRPNLPHGILRVRSRLAVLGTAAILTMAMRKSWQVQAHNLGVPF